MNIGYKDLFSCCITNTFKLVVPVCYLASYLGCFKDDEDRMFDDPRVDGGYQSDSMTVDMCTSYCGNRHHVYSGLQVCLEHLLDIRHLKCTDSCTEFIN